MFGDACMSVHHPCLRGWNRELAPLGLAMQTVVSCRVGVWSGTQAVCRSSQCSGLLSGLFSLSGASC